MSATEPLRKWYELLFQTKGSIISNNFSSAPTRCVDTFRMLQRYSADMTLTDDYENSALNYCGGAELLLQSAANINIKNSLGRTALMMATSEYSFGSRLVKLLLRHGADIALKDNRGNSALMLAVERNNYDVAQLLLRNTANINMKNFSGRTALMMATADYSFGSRLVRLLLRHGADITLTDDVGNSALMIAVQKNNYDVAQLLLQNAANVNMKNSAGQTSLMIAASTFLDNLSLVRLLLRHGADITLADNDGNSALMIAAKNNNCDVAELLLQNTENINITNYYGRTALMIAASAYSDSRRFLWLLLRRGADITLTDNDGNSALMIAVENGSYDIAELLLIEGADVTLKNCRGETALIVASHYSCTIVKLLLRYGADVSVCDKNGCTALMVAERELQYEAFKEILVYVLLSSGLFLTTDTVSKNMRLDSFWEQCRNEVITLESITLEGDITLLYYIEQNDDNSLAKYIPSLFEIPFGIFVEQVANHYASLFDMYSEMIYTKLMRGYVRYNLLQKSQCVLRCSNFRMLPLEMIFEVIKYLPNSDLGNVVLCMKRKRTLLDNL